MNRNNVQTVTLPVLVSLEDDEDIDAEHDDWARFLGNADLEEVGGVVHQVTPDDAKRWQRTHLTPRDGAIFNGVGKLYWACGGEGAEVDEFSLWQAYELLRPHVPLADPRTYKLTLDTKARTALTSVIPGVNWNAVIWSYSGLLTEKLSSIRLVMWYSEKREGFVPALYCRDKVSAIFAMQFIVRRIRVCPKCYSLFTPQASNVDYCSPAHRDSHRVARSRWWAKRKKSAVSSNARS